MVNVQVGPKSLLYIPNDWFVWDTVHSDWAGIRWSFPGHIDDNLKELRKLPLGDQSGDDHEKMLMEWDKFRVGSGAAPPATPASNPRPEAAAPPATPASNPRPEADASASGANAG